MPAECDPDLVGYTVAKCCIDDEEYEGVIGLFENVFSIRYPIAKRQSYQLANDKWQQDVERYFGNQGVQGRELSACLSEEGNAPEWGD